MGTETWDGLDAGLNYARDLREAVARALKKARIEWRQEQRAAVAAAVAEEREACAAICDERHQRMQKHLFLSCSTARGLEAGSIAAAIRSRASGGKEKEKARK